MRVRAALIIALAVVYASALRLTGRVNELDLKDLQRPPEPEKGGGRP